MCQVHDFFRNLMKYLLKHKLNYGELVYKLWGLFSWTVLG